MLEGSVWMGYSKIRIPTEAFGYYIWQKCGGYPDAGKGHPNGYSGIWMGVLAFGYNRRGEAVSIRMLKIGILMNI